MVVSWTRFHLSLIECLDSPYRRSLYSSPTVAAYCTNTPSLLLLLLLLLHTGDCRQLQVEGKGGQVSQKVKASEHAPQTEGTNVALFSQVTIPAFICLSLQWENFNSGDVGCPAKYEEKKSPFLSQQRQQELAAPTQFRKERRDVHR